MTLQILLMLKMVTSIERRCRHENVIAILLATIALTFGTMLSFYLRRLGPRLWRLLG